VRTFQHGAIYWHAQSGAHELHGSISMLFQDPAARQALGPKTQVLTVMLPPGYAPFEQYNTSGSGPFTDLYSLGATLYYCLLNAERREVAQTMRRRRRRNESPLLSAVGEMADISGLSFESLQGAARKLSCGWRPCAQPTTRSATPSPAAGVSPL
jgi:serine/threonine protein kinase